MLKYKDYSCSIWYVLDGAKEFADALLSWYEHTIAMAPYDVFWSAIDNRPMEDRVWGAPWLRYLSQFPDD